MPRKKKEDTCMNPLFLSWLEGWRDEAKEKGLNAQWTYEKAITSLKKYPLPLRSGKEAKILENIGDGIAKKLDKALEEFIRNGGDLSTMHSLPQLASPLVSKPNSQCNSSVPKRKNPSTQNDTSASSQSDKSHPEVKKRKKEYIPKPNSGPFALLLALYRESQDANFKGYLTKDELQTKAEPFIEKSFSTSEPGTHYTPWSSMSTLVKKGLVIKKSNPAKFTITDQGTHLGRRLDEIESQNPSFKPSQVRAIKKAIRPDPSHQESSISSEPQLCSSNAHDKSNLMQKASTHESTSSAGTSSVDAGLHDILSYWYVESTGKLSDRKQDAVISIDDDGIQFLIKCEEDSLMKSGVSFRIDSSRPREGQFIFAFLADKDAKGISSPQGITKGMPTLPFTGVGRINSLDAANEPVKQLFTMRPGSFEIVLCVDQMEVVGGANTNSKRMMLNQLKKMKVNMNVRKLQLGDFLWIARDKHPTVGKKCEVVLDLIVERKRMDDLSGSIVDGRFKEQKFRLKSCGLKHLVYLVEQYGSMKHLALPESTLKQAIVNSQVVDGLFVRQTASIHESAIYLSQLTQKLQNFYLGKTIHAYPVAQIKKIKEGKSFSEIIKSDVQYLMTFDDFYESTNKNKTLTVKEMFAKQLMQLKGVSAEKASAIVGNFETPSRLIMAFKSCVSQKERENLLSEITFGNTKRKIGPMLAKQICLLYISDTPLT